MEIEYYRLLSGLNGFIYTIGKYKIDVRKISKTKLIIVEVTYGVLGEPDYLYMEEIYETNKSFSYYICLIKKLMNNLSTERTPSENLIHIRREII